MADAGPFVTLEALAAHLRQEIKGTNKKCTLIFAHNGTGKTRLSMAFKDLGKQRDAEGRVTSHDTLHFNAFTEDLFSWDNDLACQRPRPGAADEHRIRLLRRSGGTRDEKPHPPALAPRDRFNPALFQQPETEGAIP